MAAAIAIFYLANVVGSYIVAHKLGKQKNRRGWIYWLLGGWIGVLILSAQPHSNSNSPQLTELEGKVREMELQQKLVALQKLGVNPDA